jgi:hypothetical protein
LDSSIVQGPFSVAPCQTLISSSPYAGVRGRAAVDPLLEHARQDGAQPLPRCRRQPQVLQQRLRLRAEGGRSSSSNSRFCLVAHSAESPMNNNTHSSDALSFP